MSDNGLLSNDEVVELPSTGATVSGNGAGDEWMDPNDTVTEAQFKAALKRETLDPPGDYVLAMDSVKSIAPIAPTGDRKGRPGGKEVTYKVVNGPPGATPPEGGWIKPRRLFKVFAEPTEGQARSMKIDRKDLFQMIQAAGVEVTGAINVLQTLKMLCEAKATVIANVDPVREVGGQDYQDVNKFRPISGGTEPPRG